MQNKIGQFVRGSNQGFQKGNKLYENPRAKATRFKKNLIPWNKGKKGLQTAWNKGKTLSKEIIEKIKNGQKGKMVSGEKHPNWKGGISKNKKDYNYKNSKKWVEKNYNKKLHLNNQRRVKKIGNGGFHILSDWEALKMKYRYMCLCCKKCEPEITLSVDHIIPISKGGSDNIENIQPLCRSCNSRKHTNICNYKEFNLLQL